MKNNGNGKSTFNKACCNITVDIPKDIFYETQIEMD